MIRELNTPALRAILFCQGQRGGLSAFHRFDCWFSFFLRHDGAFLPGFFWGLFGADIFRSCFVGGLGLLLSIIRARRFFRQSVVDGVADHCRRYICRCGVCRRVCCRCLGFRFCLCTRFDRLFDSSSRGHARLHRFFNSGRFGILQEIFIESVCAGNKQHADQHDKNEAFF